MFKLHFAETQEQESTAKAKAIAKTVSSFINAFIFCTIHSVPFCIY